MKPYYAHKGITIYHADCREFLPTADWETVDSVVTDPPYGIGIEYASYNDTLDGWFALMNEVVPLIRKSRFAVMPCCRESLLGWWYANHPPTWLICWYKGSPGHRSAIGFNDWEAHLVWGKPPKAMHDYFQTRCGFSVPGHPCPKPIEWALWLVNNAAAPGCVVLDPFMGTGTVLRAAKDLGRQAIGIEIEERYCEIAVRRLEQEVFEFTSSETLTEEHHATET